MGLCSSKVEPDLPKIEERRSAEDVHTNIENLPDEALDFNTNDASIRAAPIYADKDEHCSTENNDIKKPHPSYQKWIQELGKKPGFRLMKLMWRVLCPLKVLLS